ncbi:MAG: DUF3276 family protein [Bacteroidota bacterium]
MSNYNRDRRRDVQSAFSRKQRAGRRRTYFFDLRRTRADDYYLVLTENTRNFGRDGGGMERHKIFIYKEDINRFLENLQDTVDYLKEELMPNYDFDEFERRMEEERAAYKEQEEE